MNRKNKTLAAVAIGLCLPMLSSFGADLANSTLKIEIFEASGVISISSANPAVSGATVVRVPGATGAGSPASITDATFGAGQKVELTGTSGVVGSLRVFPGLPFALVNVSLANPGSEVQVRDKVPVASLQIGLALPADQLTTLGTGGLVKTAQKPGSYAWMAVAEPQSRHGVVAGWLTHERASGVLLADAEAGQVKIDARGEYGSLRLAPGTTTESETLAIGCFADARLGLEAWADAVVLVDKIKLHPRPNGYCTWYSDQHGRGGDEKSLPELASFAAEKLQPHGFSFVQIDDGWQPGNSKNGPNKNFTAHNPKGPYPAGMKSIADKIKAVGLTPGIWFMPFAGNWDDPWFAEHQDWFVKRKDGKPFDSKWSATCLDMTHPGAREYVRSFVSRIAHEWGYTYFKMDGFHTGAGTSNIYVNAGYKEDDMSEAVFADPGKTNIEAFRSGIRLLRETAGPDVFFLGCAATQNMRSYEGSFGLLDAMRIGPDNSGSWKGWAKASPAFGTRHYFLNGRIWWNDPDPEYVRASVTLDEARTMATWSALSGQLHTNSDWIPGLPSERLNLLQRTMAPYQATARPADFFENPVPHIWLVTDGAEANRRDVAGFYNWEDEDKALEISPERLGLAPAPAYAVFDFWANAFLPVVTGSFKTKLAPHSCQVLAIRPMQDHPFLLSTSLHVTQGIAEVSAEKWDATAKTYSARSQVVAGDPYELRLIVPAPWKAVRAESSTDAKIELRQTGTELRASFTPTATGPVDWKLIFE